MQDKLPVKRKINAQKTIESLHKNGIEIDHKKAEELLDLMYFLAKLIINQNFKK